MNTPSFFSFHYGTPCQHPRVAVSNTRSPPKLYVPGRKRNKKFENAEALAAQYEATIQTYREQGWDIIYPGGSSEKHPEVGWVGGYRVFFGDHRDTAEYIPLGEEQTNNRVELRAALRSLQGHKDRHQSLICPDSLLVVNGVLGRAQRWRRHGWQNKSGTVAHVDLWTQILHLVEKLGEAVKWLHVLSHIGIKGNGRADHLADVGRRRSPLLFGLISIRPPPPPPPHQNTRNQTTSRRSQSEGGMRSVSHSQHERPTQVWKRTPHRDPSRERRPNQGHHRRPRWGTLKSAHQYR